MHDRFLYKGVSYGCFLGWIGLRKGHGGCHAHTAIFTNDGEVLRRRSATATDEAVWFLAENGFDGAIGKASRNGIRALTGGSMHQLRCQKRSVYDELGVTFDLSGVGLIVVNAMAIEGQCRIAEQVDGA